MKKIQLTDHFALGEIVCRDKMELCPVCGGEMPVFLNWDRVIQHLIVLEILREHFENSVVIITSGYRCITHNREVSVCETPENSQHRIFATDIQMWQDKKPIEATIIYDMLDRLIDSCIGGIGIIDDITVHFDLRITGSWRRREKYK